MSRIFTLTFALMLLILIPLPTPVSHAQNAQPDVPAWMGKIAPELHAASPAEPRDFLVILTDQAEVVSQAAQISNKTEKGRWVYDTLRTHAQRTQAPVLALLRAQDAAYRPFWVVNMVWVQGDVSLMHTLAQRPDVARIAGNPAIALDTAEMTLRQPTTTTGVEWNIAKVNAPALWAQGITGEGIVVGGQDTGYAWEHPALKAQYRGWDGTTATHDYNWHDAIHVNHPNTGAGNPCGFDAPAPCDDHGHGTHTMGTMIGSDTPDTPATATNAVGMAPGASWISCRNMEEGWGSPASYTECYEWFIAPYPVGGDPLQNGDPSKAPHVINNSWSCPTYEGCDAESLRTVTENVRAAGIVTVHSAGNTGSSCSSITTPSAIYDESFTVGNTTSTDAISGSSSRGPVLADGSGRMKPDIAAPGTNIRSTHLGNGYTTMSGTSMAGPHVAGLVALLLQARPDLIGNVDAIEQAIQDSAVPLTTTQGCGGDASSAVPNNVFGWGRIDALAMYELVTYRMYLPVLQR